MLDFRGAAARWPGANMTYCLAMSVDAGLVFASDSRTNAGVDYVTTYSKMHLFTPSEDRIFVVLSAGNLATSQEIVNRVQRDLDDPGPGPNLRTVRYQFEAAGYLGGVSRAVQAEYASALNESGVSGQATLIIGGQIRGQPHDIHLVYPQGNYIAASPQTPYLQIGESKYGKPVLDRILVHSLSLADCARLSLVSLDATRGSNITVGPPFEVAIYRTDAIAIDRRLRLDMSSPEFAAIRAGWHHGLREVFAGLPRFDWELPGDPPKLEV